MIPEAAADAAMRAWGVSGDDQRRIVGTILEAAAPHMLAPVIELSDQLAASDLAGDSYLIGRGSGFRIAGIRIRQALGLSE